PQARPRPCRANCRPACLRRGVTSRTRAKPGTRATVLRSMAASTSMCAGPWLEHRANDSALGADGPALPESATLLRSHPQILSVRPRPADPRTGPPAWRDLGRDRMRDGAQPYCLDASSEMLKTAQAAVAKAELSDRIKFAQGYAEAFGPAQVGIHKPLNIIVFSYS